jgi:hypothetical protein
MALNQKYTWHDFLREHPEHREKKTKRTSAEGKKAFEAAYKAFVKKYLGELPKAYDKLVAKLEGRRKELSTKVQALRKAKKFPKAKLAQAKEGRADAAIARIKKQKERAAAAAKNF